MMGWGPYSSVTPIHKVTLTKDYYIGETEVTQALWAAVMGDAPKTGKEEHPIGDVSWNDCVEFTHQINRLVEGVTFRLPTEAEWEFAAKGGNNSEGYDYSGSSDVDRVAWHDESASQPVKQKMANEIGLYDMSGNVQEWCSDYYASYSKQDAVDPTGPTTGSTRVVRGGYYYCNVIYCTCTCRQYYSSSSSDSDNGFRLASY